MIRKILVVSTTHRPRTYCRQVDPLSALSVACPRCGAAVGQDCDRRTLGRHSYHKARIDLHTVVLAERRRNDTPDK